MNNKRFWVVDTPGFRTVMSPNGEIESFATDGLVPVCQIDEFDKHEYLVSVDKATESELISAAIGAPLRI